MFYGEGYGIKIQNGGLYRDDVDFILFDVMINDIFLEKENCIDIAKSFNIDYVPVIFEGTLKEAIDFVKTNPNSNFGSAKMEGVVKTII